MNWQHSQTINSLLQKLGPNEVCLNKSKDVKGIQLEREEEKEAPLTYADLVRDCFPSEYTWWRSKDQTEKKVKPITGFIKWRRYAKSL